MQRNNKLRFINKIIQAIIILTLVIGLFSCGSIQQQTEEKRPKGAKSLLWRMGWFCSVGWQGNISCVDSPIRGVKDPILRSLIIDSLSIILKQKNILKEIAPQRVLFQCHDDTFGLLEYGKSTIPSPHHLGRILQSCRNAMKRQLITASSTMAPWMHQSWQPQRHTPVSVSPKWITQIVSEADSAVINCNPNIDPRVANDYLKIPVSWIVKSGVITGKILLGIGWLSIITQPNHDPPGVGVNAPLVCGEGYVLNEDGNICEEIPEEDEENEDEEGFDYSEHCERENEETICPDKDGNCPEGLVINDKFQCVTPEEIEKDEAYCPPEIENCGGTCEGAQEILEYMTQTCSSLPSPWSSYQCLAYLVMLDKCPDPKIVTPNPQGGFNCGVKANLSKEEINKIVCERGAPITYPTPDGGLSRCLGANDVPSVVPGPCNDPRIEVLPEQCDETLPPPIPLSYGELINPR